MRRVLDLSMPLESGMRGVSITPAMTLESDGWNASTLSLYSHCGTHMDAPCHFETGATGVDKLPLDACVGSTIVVDLTPVDLSEEISVERFKAAAPAQDWDGARVLLRTDWSLRIGTPDYRDRLPRISLDLANWFVENKVALIGVEPPSIANVHDLDEVARIHQVLLNAGVVIIEGLTGLDRLPAEQFTLVALPLPISGGDGSPARVIAIVGADESS
jgi:kynurenine formamidase